MRRYLIILLALLAAVAGVVVLALFRSPVLGLDLQGGLEVVLQAKAPPGRDLTQADLDRSIEIMRQRIDKIGVSEPVITRQGTDQISVELAGVHDAARAAQIIGQTAQLQFFDLQGDALPPTLGASGQINASTTLLSILSGQQAAAKNGTPDAVVPLFEGQEAPGRAGRDEARDPQAVRRPAAGGLDLLRGAPGKDHPHLHRHRDHLPGRRRSCAEHDLLLPLQVPAERSDAPDSGADRERPQGRPGAAGLRGRKRADRPPRLHVERRRQVPRHHPHARPARCNPGEPGGAARQPQLLPELRHRARRRDPLVAAHRLHRPEPP